MSIISNAKKTIKVPRTPKIEKAIELAHFSEDRASEPCKKMRAKGL